MKLFADKRPALTGLLLVALFFVFSSECRAQPKPVVSIEGITEYRLDNGFRYLLFPDASSAKVTINLTIFVGSRHEGYGETGMAHLLEHMLFKGSKQFPEVDKALQEHGATNNFNGTTWVDRTNYYETMPATDKNLEFGIRFEADRMMNSFVKREDLAKEMTVVRNEFEIGENNPVAILRQRMLAVAYEWHNYGKSTIGNRSDIERVPIESLQAFYRKFYQPDNAMLVVAGKFDEQKAHQYIAKYFGAIPRPKRELPNTYTQEPTQDGERNVTLRRVGKISVVGVVYHIPSAAHPDCAATQVLEETLTSAPSGRLYKALVETKKATAVGGFAPALHDPSTIMLLALVGDKSTPEEVRDIMLNVVEDLSKTPITKEEVDRAKKKLAAQRERKLANTSSLAVELSEWAGAGDWRLMFIHRDRIAKMTANEVNKAAAKYLTKSNRTVGVFYPTEAKQIVRAEIPESPPVNDLVKDYKGGKSLAVGEEFVPTPENIEKRTQRLQLSSGVKVALLPKKTRGEKVVATITLRFGNEESLNGQSSIADFLGPMLMRGTKKYDRQQLKDELNKLGATLSTGSGLGTLSVNIQAKRKTLPAVLNLMEEVLRHPTFPEKELDILKRAEIQGLEDGLADPVQLALNKWRRTLNPYPKNSIHYQPTIEEEIERVKAVTTNKIVKLYNEQLGASVGEIAVVGDFESKATVEKLNAVFDGWKSDVPFQRIAKTAHTKVPGSRDSILTPDKKNAIYFAGYQLAMKDSAPEYPAMKMANYIIGASGFTSLLVDRLREKEGFSYGARSEFSVSPLDEYAVFAVYAFCNPENIDKVDKAAQEVLESALKNGVSNKQLEEAIKGYLQKEQVSRSSDGTLANLLEQGLYLGRTFEYHAKMDDRISKLTVKDVNAAIRDLIHLKRMVIVRAGDLAKAKKTSVEKK